MNNGYSDEFGAGVSDEKRVFYLVERKRYGDARLLLAKLLGDKPDDPDLLFHAAQIDYLEGNNTDALQTVQHALAADPNHEQARRLNFLLLVRAERKAEAEKCIIELLRDFPEEPEYYALYSDLMLRTLNLEKAAALSREAVRLDPDNQTALTVSVLSAYVNEPKAEMEDRIRDLVRRYPESEQTAYILLNLLAQQGRYREALRLAQELLRSDPNDEDLLDLIVALKMEAHWSMIPLYPLRRYGWAASAAIWLAFVVLVSVLPRTPLAFATGPLLLLFLLYVVYSWVYPPILTRLLKR